MTHRGCYCHDFEFDNGYRVLITCDKSTTIGKKGLFSVVVTDAADKLVRPCPDIFAFNFADVSTLLRKVEKFPITEPEPVNASRFYKFDATKAFDIREGKTLLTAVLVKKTYSNKNTAIIVYAAEDPVFMLNYYTMLSFNTDMSPLPDDIFVCSATPKAKLVRDALIQNGKLAVIGTYDKNRPICELVLNPDSTEESHPGISTPSYPVVSQINKKRVKPKKKLSQKTKKVARPKPFLK